MLTLLFQYSGQGRLNGKRFTKSTQPNRSSLIKIQFESKYNNYRITNLHLLAAEEIHVVENEIGKVPSDSPMDSPLPPACCRGQHVQKKTAGCLSYACACGEKIPPRTPSRDGFCLRGREEPSGKITRPATMAASSASVWRKVNHRHEAQNERQRVSSP